MSTFKLEYKLANENTYRTLTLKAKYFGAGWDEDQIDDEIKEYLYVDLDDNGIDSEDEAVIDGITYKNRAKVIRHIHSYLND